MAKDLLSVYRGFYRGDGDPIPSGRELSDGLCECGCGQRTLIAVRSSSRNNMRRGEPLRVIHGHGGRKPLRYLEEDCGYKTSCWIWQLKTDRNGYAKVRVKNIDHVAHRWYYEQHVGPVPAGWVVDHLCSVPSCVNPEHLEAVTKQENQWRAYMKRMGLTVEQRESLYEWMKTNLTAEQLDEFWSTLKWHPGT